MTSKLESERGARLDEFMQRGGIQVRSFSPRRSLEPYVRSFSVVEAAEESTRILVPDGTIVVGLRYRGRSELLGEENARRVPDTVLTGVSTKARRMRTSAGGGIVIATFRDGRASAFFAQSLHEVRGSTLDLADLLSRSETAHAHERVQEAKSTAERVAVFERLLLSCLRPDAEDPLVLSAGRAIRATHGNVRIRALARSLGVGQDSLEKRFRRHVGASPKQFASILRLHHAITSYRPGTNLTQLALDAGYFDQAHFNRDVRTTTGLSPQKLLAPDVHC
jgi:AraC-like DNA-binding protein